MNKKCGVVTILGIPNVGKSTLTNRLVGAKVSIVSPKVQTTRRRVLGICMSEDCQILFIDTPGIFVPRKRLDRAMVSAAWEATSDTDLLLIMADASHQSQNRTIAILDQALVPKIPAFLVINKIDLIPREKLLTLIAELTTDRNIDRVFLISAANGDGVKDLLPAILSHMPPGPWLYPEDQTTDLPMRFLAAEITREHIFRSIHQELPYAITVETEKWEDFDNGSVKISQVIHVQKGGQKSIVLGKGGQKIKYIREASARELHQIFGCPIHLFIHVKISENWMEQPFHYEEMGLKFKS